MRFLLFIILILLLIAALPTWPYSTGWGYYPSGGLGLIFLIVFTCRSAALKVVLSAQTNEQRLVAFNLHALEIHRLVRRRSDMNRTQVRD